MMSDVLSQSEIDALIAAMAAGEFVGEPNKTLPEEKINTASVLFEDQLKFLDKDLQLLEDIHRSYAKILSSSMFSEVHTRVSLESIQEVSYEEFRHSIPNPAVIAIFTLKPLEGYLLFETNPAFALQAADILSLGDGVQNRISLPSSHNEKDTFMQVAARFIEYLVDAWSDVLSVTAETAYIEMDPSNNKLLINNESVALLSFAATIGKVTGFFNICIPYSSMENHLGKLKITKTSPEIILNHPLECTLVNIKAVLDNLQLSFGELMGLQKGSLLNTHKPYKNKVAIHVEEKHCFDGEAGLIRNRKAVKIINCLDKDV